MIRFLLWVGFVKMGRKSNRVPLTLDGLGDYVDPIQVIWPFHVPPWWLFKVCLFNPRAFGAGLHQIPRRPSIAAALGLWCVRLRIWR